jgi:pimeloyl-ACP methyl ester carboxylesterase
VQEFTRNGLTFDVTDAGPPDGDVVVLLHGYPENRTSWQSVTPLLTDAGYRVLAPDQRGYSPRARPLRRRDYRTEELVADTLALVEASGAERVHLAGHDWGGAVAWGFAAAHPDRLHTVASLTTPHPKALLASMVRSAQLLHSWYMVFFQLPVLPEQAYTPRMEKTLRRTLAKTGLSEDAIDRYVTPLKEPNAARAAINWYRGAPLSKRADGKIRVPTLYVYATEDAFLGRKAADLTANYVDAPYRYEVLEGRTHWLPEEAPEDVARLLLEHFAAHGGR